PPRPRRRGAGGVPARGVAHPERTRAGAPPRARHRLRPPNGATGGKAVIRPPTGRVSARTEVTRRTDSVRLIIRAPPPRAPAARRGKRPRGRSAAAGAPRPGDTHPMTISLDGKVA